MTETTKNQDKTTKILGLKGMPDILPNETPQWHQFEAHWRRLMQLYSYEEIRFPLLEETKLFKRSIGEVTDIVEKEMFTFLDRNQESLSLRPEGTAGCVRACIEHGLLHNQEQRLWYMGSMFRAERPQRGRYRQFNQVGVEAFGYQGPDIEVEHLLMMARLWQWLDVEAHITLQINSLGSKSTRDLYRSKLVEYFSKYEQDLDEDSRRRLTTNPLRILDSKVKEMQELIHHAPKCYDFLDSADKAHFEDLLDRLKSAGLDFELNFRLVRGLDYYNRTVYEWVTESLGAQGTVCAGGRYDGLSEQLGGVSTPGVGFALGIERVLMVQSQQGFLNPPKANVYIICVGKAAEIEAMRFTETLRDTFPDIKFMLHCGGGNFKNQFKRADKSGADIALILGENEMLQQAVTFKYLRTEAVQETLPKEQVMLKIKEYFQHAFTSHINNQEKVL